MWRAPKARKVEPEKKWECRRQEGKDLFLQQQVLIFGMKGILLKNK